MTARYGIVYGGWLGILLVSQLAFSVEGPWGQWRGPNRDGSSAETGLLAAWPAEGPPRIWLFKDCGLGYSGPAIVGDRLYILGSRQGKEQLICLETGRGKELWSTTLGPNYENSWGDGPRSTPTVEGQFVYTLAARGNLTCCRIRDGSIVWQKSLQDFGGQIPEWGYSESPLIYEDLIICTPGGEQGAIVALDKSSGELLWQTSDLADIAHYSSIIVTNQADRAIGVQLLVSQLVGFNLV
ncbi:MAG: PQQ-binding-like beta-propeller repeat protein, partial [Pirellulales bacterium]|nr:PQQ-binding-like beta-propeller repeat protein [Pirellulales bacterium]